MEHPVHINFISKNELLSFSLTKIIQTLSEIILWNIGTLVHLIVHEIIKNSNGTSYKYIIYMYTIYPNIKQIYLEDILHVPNLNT